MRVVIAEDSVLLREGLARLLADAGCGIVARVGAGPGSVAAREREVLALRAEGRSNAAIADIISIGEGAVEKHVGNIFGKLGLAPTDTDHRRVLAVLTYLRS